MSLDLRHHRDPAKTLAAILKLNQGIVLTLSAEPIGVLPPSPLKFLLRLRQLAGHTRSFQTRTSSLATIMGVTTNTIRAWTRILEEFGYIHVLRDPRQQTWRVFIRIHCEPPSRQAQLAKETPTRSKPEPKPWWKLPAKSAFCLGGAKWIASIKTRNISLPQFTLSQTRHA